VGGLVQAASDGMPAQAMARFISATARTAASWSVSGASEAALASGL